MLSDLRFALRQLTKTPGFTTVTFFALAAASIGSASVGPAETSQLQFALPDQFDLDHTAAAYAGKIVVLTVTDREGSRFGGDWVKAILETLPSDLRSKVHIVSAANLRGVPGFVRSFVKGKFPQDPHTWVLLDWHGQLEKTYALAPKCCNLLLFSPDGRLVQKIAGREVRPDDVTAMARAIGSLGGNSPSSPVPKPRDEPRRSAGDEDGHAA